jgi:hypothetical protein
MTPISRNYLPSSALLTDFFSCKSVCLDPGSSLSQQHNLAVHLVGLCGVYLCVHLSQLTAETLALHNLGCTGHRAFM